MPALLQYIFPCLTGRHASKIYLPEQSFPSEKQPFIMSTDDDVKAAQLVDQLFAAQTSEDLNNIVRPQSWSSSLAKAILARLQQQLEDGVEMGDALRAKVESAKREATSFAEKHPILTAVLGTVVVLAILALVFPWALEALGFAELGPVEGSWAAAWQSTYAGSVEAGSWFSFFQRLGMTLPFKG